MCYLKKSAPPSHTALLSLNGGLWLSPAPVFVGHGQGTCRKGCEPRGDQHESRASALEESLYATGPVHSRQFISSYPHPSRQPPFSPLLLDLQPDPGTAQKACNSLIAPERRRSLLPCQHPSTCRPSSHRVQRLNSAPRRSAGESTSTARNVVAQSQNVSQKQGRRGKMTSAATPRTTFMLYFARWYMAVRDMVTALTPR